MSNPHPSAIRIVAIRQPFAVFEHRPWRPPLNIYETEQGLQLIVELAGIALDDLHVHVYSTNVRIQGTRQLARYPYPRAGWSGAEGWTIGGDQRAALTGSSSGRR